MAVLSLNFTNRLSLRVNWVGRFPNRVEYPYFFYNDIYYMRRRLH